MEIIVKVCVAKGVHLHSISRIAELDIKKNGGR